MTEHNRRHGGPYDRGGADSYYRRGIHPHYFKDKTYMSDKVTDLTPKEVADYMAGYMANEKLGYFKDWE